MSGIVKSSSEPKGWIRRIWVLYWIAWILSPVVFGWFFADRIECKSCFRDVFIHYIGFFGYVVLGGFVYSFSLPSRRNVPNGSKEAAPNGYMLGTQEDVIFTFALFGALFSGFFFFTTYQF